MNLYSIYDEVAKEYSQPYMMSNNGVAIRWFSSICEKQSIPVADCKLYFIGKFDVETGKLEDCVPPELIDSGVNYLHEEK